MIRYPFWLAVAVLLSCSRTADDVLRVAISGRMISYDPHLQDEVVTVETLNNIYESLVSFDLDMGMVPVLCTGYASLSDLRWRFYLRPGVKFHNGKYLRAEDAAYSLARARDSRESVFRSMMASVSRIEAVDSLTLDIVTFKPRPNLIPALSLISIIPAGHHPGQSPVGTGPYRYLGDSSPDRLVLEAFPEYWGPKPDFARAEYLVIEDDEKRKGLFLNGTIDVNAAIEESEIASLSGEGKINLITKPGATVSLLAMNVSGNPRDNPLADQRVRRAISLAIDRQDMAQQVCRGHAIPANQVLTRSIIGYNPALPEIGQDLSEARRLIESLNLKGPLSLTLEVSTGARVEGEYLARQLAEAGISLTVRAMPWDSLYGRIEAGLSPFYLMGFGYSYNDAGEMLNEMIHSRGHWTDFGVRNQSGYSNPWLDKLIEQADRELSPEKRRQLLQEAVAVIYRELPLIPLYIRGSNYGLSRDIAWEQRTAGFLLARDLHPKKARRS